MPSIFDSILLFIHNLMLSPVTLATVAAILEFLLHRIPSDKPLGMLHMIAMGFSKIGELLSSLGALLDKLLPQNLKG